MEQISLIISVVALVLSLIVLIKFFVLCSDVRRIADKVDPESKKRRETELAEYSAFINNEQKQNT